MIEINIQMPEKCGLCPCFHSDNPMYCQAVKADKIKKIVAPYGAPRPEWCPLKEQESVEPTLIREGRNKYYNYYVCPRCGDEVVYDTNYCSECGVRFLWEGR